MTDTTITINMDAKCAECGKGGAAASGICLACTAKAIGPSKPMRSQAGRAIQARMDRLRNAKTENGGTTMTEVTTIVKIKRKLEGVEIHAELELAGGRGVKATVLKCADEPLASFTKAMDALEVGVRAILELEPEQWDSAFTVTGVSFNSGNDDGEGVVVTSQVALAASENALVLNTPNLPVKNLAEPMQKALEKVREEAQAYLDGKRKGDLFAKAA